MDSKNETSAEGGGSFLSKDSSFEKSLYAHEVRREGTENILYVNYLGAPFVPSVADYSDVMARTIEVLIENQNVSRVIFVQQKNYNYDFKETSFLLEVAALYTFLVEHERILSKEKISSMSDRFFPERYNEIFRFLTMLKGDPIFAYSELKKMIIRGKVSLRRIGSAHASEQESYISLLEKILGLVEKLGLIRDVLPIISDYKKGDREIYHRIFKPDVIPNFTFARLVSDFPGGAEMIDQYEISEGEADVSLVTIFKKKDESKFIYHIVPPENSLDEDQNMLLNLARRVLLEHQPKAEELTDTERSRQVFFNISKDLLQDLAKSKGIKVN
ncbi:MAG: hypothetical protein Q8P81_04060, partial [Nanoarchaeota archaeon]|nr:hypothetical protein [Nanoarchaeota archaeon]